jgi:hypothetical protein
MERLVDMTGNDRDVAGARRLPPAIGFAARFACA